MDINVNAYLCWLHLNLMSLPINYDHVEIRWFLRDYNIMKYNELTFGFFFTPTKTFMFPSKKSYKAFRRPLRRIIVV